MGRLLCILTILVTGVSYGTAVHSEGAFQYGDSLRTYVVLTPSYGPGPEGYPLVIGLHGTGATGNIFIVTASLARKVEDEGFVLANPDGLDWGEYTFFNAGGEFEDLTGGIDDVGFISALMDTMMKNYDIDPARVYVIGFSNGSAMAYRVAAELSDRVAAIGAVSGQMVLDQINPSNPVPIIHFHGLSDRFIPYEGRNSVPSVMSRIEIWKAINGCTGDPVTIRDSDGILGLRWNSSDGRGDIELYTIEDQEHEWPRESSLGIQATDVIWDFLKGYSR